MSGRGLIQCDKLRLNNSSAGHSARFAPINELTKERVEPEAPPGRRVHYATREKASALMVALEGRSGCILINWIASCTLLILISSGRFGLIYILVFILKTFRN